MCKAKVFLVSLLTLFVMGALTSASASALLWSVSGFTTFETEAISNALITIAGGKLEGEGIATTCPMLKIEGGLIKEGSTGMVTAAFSECKELNESANCELSSEKIQTNPVSMNIIGAEEFEIAPESTTEFTTLKLNNKSGKTCTLKGIYVLRGYARADVGNASSEEAEHSLTFSVTSHLTFNHSFPVTIEGSGKVKLTSGSKWSIMNP